MYTIAGVTGHVGSAVAKNLLERGKPARVIVRDAAKGAPWAKLGAEVSVGSLDDSAFVATALRGAKGFFTLLPPHYGASDFYGAQRKTADSVAAAVKAAGAPYVVLLSSVGADLAQGNGPIKGLHYFENALNATGAKLAAVRAGYFQENVANSLAPARQAGVFPNFMPSADYPVPMIATKDIGRLAAELLLVDPPKSEVVDLQGPAYSIRQVAQMLGDALGKPLKVVDIPQAGWVDAMTQGGVPKNIAEVFAEMYAGFASGAIRPKGQRLVKGTTELPEVIRALVG